MKRFDKGYIFYHLLYDLFKSAVLFFLFFSDFFFEETEADAGVMSALPFLIGAFLVIYLCFILYRILYQRTSGYELTETEIKCKRGVFFKKSSVLEYGKVHAINKKQNIIHKIFGIAVLTVDSGSANTSTQAEITVFEKEKTVDALLNELNSLKENGAHRESAADNDELLISERDSLYSFTSAKKMLYTAISIAQTAFYTALFGIMAIAVLSVLKLIIRENFLGTWGEYFFFALTVSVGAMLLASVISFIACLINSFVKYFGFTVTKRENNLLISYGLLEKHTNTFSLDRIKAVKISQGLVQRILGFATINLEVIGYLNETGNSSTELGVLVPFCKFSEVDEILERVLPGYKPAKKQTKAQAFFPFVSWFSLILGIAAVATIPAIAAVAVLLNAPPSVVFTACAAGAFVFLIILAVKYADALLAYQNNGIAFDGDKVTAYGGGLMKTVTVFFAKNLVAVEDVTTPMRKRAGITSLTLHLRTNELTNEIKVHIQKDAVSDELLKLLTV